MYTDKVHSPSLLWEGTLEKEHQGAPSQPNHTSSSRVPRRRELGVVSIGGPVSIHMFLGTPYVGAAQGQEEGLEVNKACLVKFSLHCQVLSVHMQMVSLWVYDRSATLETPAWTAGLKMILWMTEKFCSLFQILFSFFSGESLKYTVQRALLGIL